MFNEISYLGATYSNPALQGGAIPIPSLSPSGPGTIVTQAPPGAALNPAWAALGFGTKKEWKQAGRPGVPSAPPIGTPPAPPSLGLPSGIGAPGSIDTSGGGGSSTGDGSSSTSGGGISGLLSGIPSSWLLIGGVILLVVVLKK